MQKLPYIPILQYMNTYLKLDYGGEEYLIDLDMEPLIRNRIVWTNEQQVLMIRIQATHRDGLIYEMPLHEFIYRTMTYSDLPDELVLRFKDGNARNVTYANLERITSRRSA